ncbi:Fic/DOC family protein [Deinococcus petrolearius]
MENLLGIERAGELAVTEADYAAARTVQLREGRAPAGTRGNFDLAHLKAIHRHLFGDVYGWAGTTRAEPLTLGGVTVRQPPLLMKGTTTFEAGNRVNARLEAAFDRLRAEGYLQGLSREAFSERAADLLIQINNAHPFREGNGRTQREFMLQLAEQAGHPLNFDPISQQRMIVASYDGIQGDPSTMRRLFDEISDPDRVAVLERGVQYLEGARQHGPEWEEMYVATMTTGREYRGPLVAKGQEFFVMASEGGAIVGHPQDLPEGHGRYVTVQATPFPSVDGGPQPRLEHDLDY